VSAELVDDLPSYKPGHVLHAKTGGYLVLSRSTPGVWYLVYGGSCSCKAGQTGSLVCWHRTQVARFVREIDRDLARPTAPPHIGAFCD
jgi:hypothetical protein